MKGIAVVLLSLAVGIIGCKTQSPPKKWKVELVRPDGETHKVFIVHSRLKPKVNPMRGGQMQLYSDSGGGEAWRYDDTGLVAPAGWAFVCEAK